MDDTVIFATSKTSLEKKLKLLKAEADKLGMMIHPTKSKFMSTDPNDTSPIVLENVKISHTKTYIYLGAVISIIATVDQIKAQMKDKYCQVLKFYAFLNKNNDAPFSVKKQVWDSALASSIFYSSETWLTYDLKCVQSTYRATLKQLLGVRKSTPTDCLLIECGMPTAKVYIQSK